MSKDLAGLVKGLARGGLFLMVGQVIGTIVSAVTVVLIARMIGSERYGEISIAMIPVALLLLLQDLGIASALMMFSNKLRKEERMAELRGIVSTGLVFYASLALLMSALLFFFAGPVASIWLRRPDLENLVRVAALGILGQGIMTSLQAVLIGFELMSYHAVSQIAYSLLRAAIAFPLILLGFGAYGPVAANAVAYLLVGSFGALLFYMKVKFRVYADSPGFRDSLKSIFGFGLPLYWGSLVSGGLGQVYSTLMATNVSAEIIGNYSAATNFLVLVGFFTMPINLTLFSMFSKMGRFDSQLGSLFHNAVKFTCMVVTPIAACLILVSAPMTSIIYGEGYPYASLYLSLLLILYLFEGFGGTSLGNLFMGLGESRVIFNSNLIQLLVGVPLSLILVPRYQIVGLLAVMIVAPRVSLLYQLYWLKNMVGLSVNLGSSARVYLSTAAAFTVGYLTLTLLRFEGWAALLVGGVLFFSVYLLALPLSGSFDVQDFLQLDELVGIVGPFASPIREILRLMKRFVRS